MLLSQVDHHLFHYDPDNAVAVYNDMCQLVIGVVSQLTGILCQVDPRQRGIPTSNSKKSSTFPFLILCHVETDENVKFHRGEQVYALQLFFCVANIFG